MEPCRLIFLYKILLSSYKDKDSVESFFMKIWSILDRVVLACVLVAVFLEPVSTAVFPSEDYRISANPIITKLNHPWSAIWLPDQGDNEKVLISERNGDLVLADPDTGKITKLVIPNTVNPYQAGQGGLLDLALAPNYSKSGWIYLSLSVRKRGGSTTALTRFRLKTDSANPEITDFELLFEADPVVSSGIHFGSRIVFPKASDSTATDVLFLAVGERGQGKTVQLVRNHIGKVIRFDYTKNFSPRVYSTGHRNPQGMVWDPLGKQLLLNEHGAKGGDEINIIRQGKNYGWPVISYGRNYNGTKIGVGTSKAGMEQPMYYWDPSIAPSGMIVYKGSEFPNWNKNLLVGSLKFGLLVRLKLNSARNEVINEERILGGRLGRIRHISQDGQGHLYVLTDSSSGILYRLTRAR